MSLFEDSTVTMEASDSSELANFEVLQDPRRAWVTGFLSCKNSSIKITHA